MISDTTKSDYQRFAEAQVAKYYADKEAGLHRRVQEDGTVLVPILVWNCQILEWGPEQPPSSKDAVVSQL
jgi:hypothetical protein